MNMAKQTGESPKFTKTTNGCGRHSKMNPIVEIFYSEPQYQPDSGF